MATRSAFRVVILKEPWRTVPKTDGFPPPPLLACRKSSSSLGSGCACGISSRARVSDWPARHRARCFHSGTSSSSSEEEGEQGPPQEAVLKAISEVSKAEGRVGQTTNMVLGGTVTAYSTNEWFVLDQKVNSYPTVRGFTAIGTGGDDFVQAMVVAVESVIQYPIPQGQVKQKLSSGGKYVSVNIGPVQVVSSEQVQAVYNAMRRDDRMKYFL